VPGTLIDERGRVVCARCEVAHTFFEREKGLLGRKSLGPDEGLLIERRSAIHTFFMAFPIDIVFLDRDLRVRSIAREVRPFRMVLRPGARNVVELASGAAERVGLEPGSTLSWQESS
jgi:uncharacterized membrane protein (UPF0127 family)